MTTPNDVTPVSNDFAREPAPEAVTRFTDPSPPAIGGPPSEPDPAISVSVVSMGALPDPVVEPIPGAGWDASPEQRPGVPMELEPPRPVGMARWAEPGRQPDPGNILRRKGLEELTPVFGTGVPPRGVSGLMRRAAYRIAEHKTSHWLLLLLADRVDALEHGGRGALPLVALVGAGVGVYAFTRHARQSRFARFARYVRG